MKYYSIFIVVVLVIGFILFGLLMGNPKEKTNDRRKRTIELQGETGYISDNRISDKLLIYNLAANLVKKSLQEPSTAEFPNTEERLEHVAYLGSERYRIDSWVDSQDTYAAMVRKNFTIVLKFDGSKMTKEKYTIDEFGHIPLKQESNIYRARK